MESELKKNICHTFFKSTPCPILATKGTLQLYQGIFVGLANWFGSMSEVLGFEPQSSDPQPDAMTLGPRGDIAV